MKPRRGTVPTGDMREVLREVARCCKVAGVPGFRHYVRVVLGTPKQTGGALGCATSPWVTEHVGKTCPREHKVGWPVIVLHYAKWRRLSPLARKQVVAHEVAHLLEDVWGRRVDQHGARFRATDVMLQRSR